MSEMRQMSIGRAQQLAQLKNMSQIGAAEHDQGIEQTERRRGDHEHVDRRDVGKVIAQKAPPGRGGDLGAPGHPPPDRGLADLDAELEQFPVDARCTPQRVGITHAANQITCFWADPGPSRTT